MYTEIDVITTPYDSKSYLVSEIRCLIQHIPPTHSHWAAGDKLGKVSLLCCIISAPYLKQHLDWHAS